MDRYIISFFVYSFLGWVWESIFCTAKQKKWANRGFLYGPICPIYGFGATLGLGIYDLILSGKITPLPIPLIFAAGFIVSLVLEYPTSYVLEKLFHARWWDYTDVPLNINGRTSVPTSIAFGAAAILIMKGFIPCIDRIFIYLPENLIAIFALVLVSLCSIDTTLTVTALTDFQKRVNAVESNFQEHMTEAVDKFYSYQGTVFNRAVGRAVSFKHIGVKQRIAEQLMHEKKLEDLFNEYFRIKEEKQER